jgi:hypothetical protein
MQETAFQHSPTHDLSRDACRKLLSNIHLRMTCRAMHAGTVSTTARIAGGDPKAFHHRAIQTLSTKTATMMSVSMPGAYRHALRCCLASSFAHCLYTPIFCFVNGLYALLLTASTCAHFLRCELSCVLFYSLPPHALISCAVNSLPCSFNSHEALLFIFGRCFFFSLACPFWTPSEPGCRGPATAACDWPP